MMHFLRIMNTKLVLIETLHYCSNSKRSRATHVVLWLFLLGAIPSAAMGAIPRRHRGIDMCEPIAIPMCAGMPYNMTRMPNHLHHSTQENARLAIEPYGELLKQNCSADLLFFLCAMFAPICTPQFQKEAIPPCRSVCERSRHGCEPVMNQYNYSWPVDLNCDQLPEYDKGVCVSPEAIVSSMPEETATSTEDAIPERKPQHNCTCSSRIKPSKSAYKKGKYDFAMAATVKHVTTLEDTQSIILVTINAVLRRGKVHLQENKNIDLWSNSTCVCPNLKVGRDYLIIGEEDVLLNKLKFSEKTLVTRWNKKWERKFKKWKPRRKKNKNKNKGRRCDKKGRCKKDRKKNKKAKVRCRVQQSGEHSQRLRCTQQAQKGGRRRDEQSRNALKRKDNGAKRNRHKSNRRGNDNAAGK